MILVTLFLRIAAYHFHKQDTYETPVVQWQPLFVALMIKRTTYYYI